MKTVVNDNGMSHHKLAWLDENSVIRTRKFPSLVKDANVPLTDTSGKEIDSYKIDNQIFICSSMVREHINVRSADYQKSNANKALIAHAIFQAGLIDEEIELITTLPFHHCYSSGVKDSVKMDAVSEFYRGRSVQCMGTDKYLNVVKSRPYPEALSAFFDWSITGSLEPNPEINGISGPVGVIDIGGGTTDIVTIGVSGTSIAIDHSRSNTVEKGVLDLVGAVGALLESEIKKKHPEKNLRADGGIPQNIITTLITEGSVNINTVGFIDLAAEVDLKIEMVGQSIINAINSIVGNLMQYDKLIICGGGAIVFKKFLEKAFPGATVLDEYANARGALKYHLGK